MKVKVTLPAHSRQGRGTDRDGNGQKVRICTNNEAFVGFFDGKIISHRLCTGVWLRGLCGLAILGKSQTRRASRGSKERGFE